MKACLGCNSDPECFARAGALAGTMNYVMRICSAKQFALVAIQAQVVNNQFEETNLIDKAAHAVHSGLKSSVGSHHE